jgi:hypothetical protein
MSDFELAFVHSTAREFPACTQAGCFFHYMQAMWRNITGPARARYTADDEYALCIRQLGALAFVPVNDVVAAFEALVASEFFVVNADELEDILDYVQRTWIGRPAVIAGGARRAPRFSHRLWNCYTAMLNGQARTNNSVESWHRSFEHLLRASHPSIWSLIDALRKDSAAALMDLERLNAGAPPPKRRREYEALDQRLLTLVQDYDNRPTLEYLRGIAHNIMF